MTPLDTGSTVAAWIGSVAGLIAVFISMAALVYARNEANAAAASAKSAQDSADEARRANEIAARADERALAAAERNRYRWEVVHYENEAYRLFNLGTHVAHDVTMTVNYPDEWLLDLPTDAVIAPGDWHKFRISPSMSPEMPDFVLVSWREHPEPMRVPLPLQSWGRGRTGQPGRQRQDEAESFAILAEFGTKRRVSDQLSDYGCAYGHQSAHVHAPLSRSTTVARGVPILVRDEEVRGGAGSEQLLRR